MAEKVCSVEGCAGIPRVRGWCANHYAMIMRRGTTEPAQRKHNYREPKEPRVNRTGVGTQCEVDGCSNFITAMGLCRKHYFRERKRGTVILPPKAIRARHPLYSIWKSARNSSMGVVEAWNDFAIWLSDVGERPTPKHRFLRPILEVPAGPENFKWFLADPIEQGLSRQAHFRALEARTRTPASERARHLRKTFGISMDEYDAILARQGGVCACCRKPQEMIVKKTASIVVLAVDHDHETGKVRGLLCQKCNSGIGMLGDTLEGVERAWNYLHAAADNRDEDAA